jgi:tetratricopeptide (TPR) repeat protein
VVKELLTCLVLTFLLVSCAATPAGNYNNEQGRALMAEKKWRESIEFFNKAIAENPNSSAYYYNVGFAYFHLDEFENSSNFLKKAIDLQQNNWARTTLRRLYEDKGRLGELVEYYESRVAKKPNDAHELSHLGLTYAYAERIKDAIRASSKASTIEPDDIILKDNLKIIKEIDIGITRYNNGDYAEAIKALQNASKLGGREVFVVEKYLDLARKKLKKEN